VDARAAMSRRKTLRSSILKPGSPQNLIPSNLETLKNPDMYTLHLDTAENPKP